MKEQHLEMFQIKVVLPRHKKESKKQKKRSTENNMYFGFLFKALLSWLSQLFVRTLSSVSVCSATSAAAAFTFASDPAPLAQNYLNPTAQRSRSGFASVYLDSCQ